MTERSLSDLVADWGGFEQLVAHPSGPEVKMTLQL